MTEVEAAAKAQRLLELRRKRNRDSMRRARVRQRAERGRMQRAIDALEAQLRGLLRSQRLQTDPAASDRASEALARYGRLLTAGEQLRRQNGALERGIREHEAFQARVARETEDEIEDARGLGRQPPTAVAASGSSAEEEDAREAAPLPTWLSADRRRQLIAFAVDMFVSNARRTDALMEHANLVLGWTDKRGVFDGSWAQFVQTKDFPNESAEALLARSWAASTDIKAMSKMLSWATGMKLLHRLSDSAVVIARVLHLPNSADPDHPILYRYSLLVYKAPIDGGYVLSTQTINLDGADNVEQSLAQKELKKAGIPLVTMYGLTFTHMKDDRGCRVQLAGRTSDGQLSYAHKVLIESLPAVLRWENSCVAPILRVAG